MQHYHPREKELTKNDLPRTSAPLPQYLREQAVNNLIRSSPVKNVDQMATLRDQPIGFTPNELAKDQKAEDLKKIRKTLALNQRLMDTSNNLDALLNAYAGSLPVKDQRK